MSSFGFAQDKLRMKRSGIPKGHYSEKSLKTLLVRGDFKDFSPLGGSK
jgi:hypothetical protein